MIEPILISELTINVIEGKNYCGECSALIENMISDSKQVAIDDMSSPDPRDWTPIYEQTSMLLPCRHAVRSLL